MQFIAENSLILSATPPPSNIPDDKSPPISTTVWKMASIQKLRVDAYIMQNSTPMRPAEITCIRQLLNLTPAPILEKCINPNSTPPKTTAPVIPPFVFGKALSSRLNTTPLNTSSSTSPTRQTAIKKKMML